MNSDDEMYSAENSDSCEEDDAEDDIDDEYVMTLDQDAAASLLQASVGDDDDPEDRYDYEVLSPDQIVKYMVKCIREVNTVVQVNRVI